MTHIENEQDENTPENSSFSNDSDRSTDLTAHSQEQQPKTSSSKNTNGTPHSLIKLKEEGGSLDKLISNAAEILGDRDSAIITGFLKRNSRGFVGALPLICKGEACPFLSACPLYEAKKELPIGARCPVESTLVQLWVNKHLEALGIDDYDSPEYSFDMDILYELAAHELIRWRLAGHLSEEGSLIEEVHVGDTDSGEPLFEKVINPILDELQKHTKIALRLKEALLATRQAKSSAGKVSSDPTKKAAELMKRIYNMLEQKERIHDAEYREVDNGDALEQGTDGPTS